MIKAFELNGCQLGRKSRQEITCLIRAAILTKIAVGIVKGVFSVIRKDDLRSWHYCCKPRSCESFKRNFKDTAWSVRQLKRKDSLVATELRAP